MTTSMPVPTTSQQLGTLIKAARAIMRKDKGLNGDLDRLPMLTWIMFLKFLDDLDIQREEESQLSGKGFRPTIERPYRWRDWAAKSDGITGDELLAFVNQEECVRPDGTRGAGLFTHLRGLTSANGDDRRDVVATVFRGVDNRMRSGYLLRDVINKVNEVHFTSSDELHTLGHLYESMLREMRDAAGDSGEFYTPRSVVRLMVEITNPRLGDTVLDPACGTGGFLVEAFKHLEAQVKTVPDRKALQTKSIFGYEAKPLPFLLCQMNLLLHGLESPQIDSGNALRYPLGEIGDRDRVDVILTNPPFGGEEERGILANFPRDRQTTETALLFLQLIMRKLRRAPKPGRAAVVVPDGILGADGIAERVKQELLREFNLHTILRLPSGVFAPYTGIPTNVMFFDRSGPTRELWYYEHPLPEDRKTYTKTAPLDYSEFAEMLKWWSDRKPGRHAWKVAVSEVFADGCNLDIRNPALGAETAGKPSSALMADLAGEISAFGQKVSNEAGNPAWKELDGAHGGAWSTVKLNDILERVEQSEEINTDESYRLIGVRLAGEGPFLRETKTGVEIKATRLNRVTKGLFIYSRLFAWRGAFGLVPPELDGGYASNEFPTYRINHAVVLPDFLRLYFSRPVVWQTVEKKCQGTTKASRNRFKEEFLLGMSISLPTLEVQQAIVERAKSLSDLHTTLRDLAQEFGHAPLDVLASTYRGKL